MTINETTGLIEWTPSSTGDYDVTVEATNDNGTDTQDFTLSVYTEAPTITSTPVTTTVVDRPYTYDVDAVGNPDATYSLTVSPTGMTINGTTGLIEWTPVSTGDYDVTIQASNGVDPVATQSFTISVLDPPDRVTDGLVVFYAFDEGSGTTIKDLSGVGTPLDMTVADEGDIIWLSGGLSIDSSTIINSGGTAEKVINACQASNEITIEAWITPANTSQYGPARIVTLSADPSNRNFMIGQGAATGSPELYSLRLRTTDTENHGKPVLFTPEGSLTAQLTHLVFTHDSSGNDTIYINGIEVSSGTRSGDFSNWNDYLLALGNEVTGDRPWLGEFYLLAIFNRAFSSNEVEQNYNGDYTQPWPPSIYTHPGNQTIFEGEQATFSVLASGTQPLSYQWQRNQVVIPGATSSSYTLTTTIDDDGAMFRCVVTNAAGDAFSNEATLTVTLDTDGDGVPDDQDDDDDNDGMPDVWENEHGLNPLVDDASGDADFDGYSNYQEYQFGTDPNDPNSHPKAKPWIPLLLLDD
jgi:hypothetical protein